MFWDIIIHITSILSDIQKYTRGTKMKIRAIASSYTTVGIWLIDDAISVSVSYVDRRQRLILYMFKSASGDIIIINEFRL